MSILFRLYLLFEAQKNSHSISAPPTEINKEAKPSVCRRTTKYSFLNIQPQGPKVLTATAKVSKLRIPIPPPPSEFIIGMPAELSAQEL